MGIWLRKSTKNNCRLMPNAHDASFYRYTIQGGPIKTVPFVFRCPIRTGYAVCWIICHIKRQSFSHKMTSILFWNIKWLFVRFTFCHRTTVTLDTQWQNAHTFLERINLRPGGETSRGRNAQLAKRPGGEMSCEGAKRPEGETSKGRNVHKPQMVPFFHDLEWPLTHISRSR